MNQAVVILGCVAFALTLFAWRKGRESAVRGWLGGAKSLRQQLPMLFIAFAMAGFVEALVPASLVRSWLGAEAGIKGVILGSMAGGLLPFGPYIIFPMAAAIRAAGAGDATAVAFVTGWMLLSTSRFAYEMATLGPGFSARRVALFVPATLAAGALALLMLR